MSCWIFTLGAFITLKSVFVCFGAKIAQKLDCERSIIYKSKYIECSGTFA